MLLLSARGAVAAATEAIDQPGTYEPVVIGLDPAVYLKFDEIGGTSLGDSSGHGRSGMLMGTGATFGAAALAPNVGTTNKAVNLGSGAWIEIPHAAVDAALSFPSSQPWIGGRKIADVTVSIYFEPNSLPSGTTGTSSSRSRTRRRQAMPRATPKRIPSSPLRAPR
jgi:hypothetical protein